MTEPLHGTVFNSNILNQLKEYVDVHGDEQRRWDAIQFTKDRILLNGGVFFQTSTTDHAWALTRSDEDVEKNSKMRNLLLEGVLAETKCTVDTLPRVIREAMNLDSDYELGENIKDTGGKPLTAYRLKQVFTAVSQWKAENENRGEAAVPVDIAVAIANAVDGNDEKNAIANLAEASAASFKVFDGFVTPGKMVPPAVDHFNTVILKLKSLIKNVSRQRKITPEDIKDFRGNIERAKKIVKEGVKILDIYQAHNPMEDFTDEHMLGEKRTVYFPAELIEPALLALDKLEKMFAEAQG